MKKIFIYAWLAGNLGDDLFVQMLCERYPATKFCVLADNQYKERFFSLAKLNSTEGWNLTLQVRFVSIRGI